MAKQNTLVELKKSFKPHAASSNIKQVCDFHHRRFYFCFQVHDFLNHLIIVLH